MYYDRKSKLCKKEVVGKIYPFGCLSFIKKKSTFHTSTFFQEKIGWDFHTYAFISTAIVPNLNLTDAGGWQLYSLSKRRKSLEVHNIAQSKHTRGLRCKAFWRAVYETYYVNSTKCYVRRKKTNKKAQKTIQPPKFFSLNFSRIWIILLIKREKFV